MKNDFQLTIGARFTFRTQPMPHWNGVVDCEVLAVEPHQRLPIAGTPRAVCRPPSPGRSFPSRAARGCAWSSRASAAGRQHYKARYGWQRNVDALEKSRELASA